MLSFRVSSGGVSAGRVPGREFHETRADRELRSTRTARGTSLAEWLDHIGRACLGGATLGA